jgi:hypothetical protein
MLDLSQGSQILPVITPANCPRDVAFVKSEGEGAKAYNNPAISHVLYQFPMNDEQRAYLGELNGHVTQAFTQASINSSDPNPRRPFIKFFPNQSGFSFFGDRTAVSVKSPRDIRAKTFAGMYPPGRGKGQMASLTSMLAQHFLAITGMAKGWPEKSLFTVNHDVFPVPNRAIEHLHEHKGPVGVISWAGAAGTVIASWAKLQEAAARKEPWVAAAVSSGAVRENPNIQFASSPRVAAIAPTLRQAPPETLVIVKPVQAGHLASSHAEAWRSQTDPLQLAHMRLRTRMFTFTPPDSKGP